MDDFPLIQSTGKEHIDRLLRGIVGIYSQAFPGRSIFLHCGILELCKNARGDFYE